MHITNTQAMKLGAYVHILRMITLKLRYKTVHEVSFTVMKKLKEEKNM